MIKPYTRGAIRDAKWIMEFSPDTLWTLAGFSANRGAELLRMGVLTPAATPGTYRAVMIDTSTLPIR